MRSGGIRLGQELPVALPRPSALPGTVSSVTRGGDGLHGHEGPFWFPELLTQDYEFHGWEQLKNKTKKLNFFWVFFSLNK